MSRNRALGVQHRVKLRDRRERALERLAIRVAPGLPRVSDLPEQEVPLHLDSSHRGDSRTLPVRRISGRIPALRIFQPLRYPLAQSRGVFEAGGAVVAPRIFINGARDFEPACKSNHLPLRKVDHRRELLG